MSRIPRIEEWLTRHKTSFIIIMETQKTFIGRVMRRPGIQMRLLMKVVPLDIELKG
jgi:hypothetical protein